MEYRSSLREKIGQLFMIGFEGTEVSKEVIEMIEKEKIGSVCLFPRNIESPQQVLKLTSDLQTVAKENGYHFPLIIAMDQENGIVRRLKRGVTELPGSMLLGAIDDVETTRQVSEITAQELKALGVNMNLAPVLDVNNNPQNPVIGVRSFGESPEKVAEHGKAFVVGHKKNGMITSAKHFPGHGDTTIDSHKGLPTIDHSLEHLKKTELLPFYEVMKADTDVVMTSHIHFSELDQEKEVPASLSENVTTGLLREKMGFQGVVITDSLEMDAVADYLGTVDGALQALKAGADLLLFSHTRSIQKEALDRFEEAVNKDELSEEIIDRAVDRILRLKQKYLSWNECLPRTQVPSLVGSKEHKEFAQLQYNRGVTVIKGGETLPLNLKTEETMLIVSVSGDSQTGIEEERGKQTMLSNKVSFHHKNVLTEEIDTEPNQCVIQRICEVANEVDVIVVSADNASRFKQQIDLVRELEKKKKNLIIISFKSPYDFLCFPEVPVFIATYEPTVAAVQSAVDVLFGELPAQGKLPVTMPGYTNE